MIVYFSLKEHLLKTSNKKTHIPLLINQFVSLIELKTRVKLTGVKLKYIK